MPTATKQQKSSTKDVEIKRLNKLLERERANKEADLRKLAAQALRSGSSQGGTMLAALRKKGRS